MTDHVEPPVTLHVRDERSPHGVTVVALILAMETAALAIGSLVLVLMIGLRDRHDLRADFEADRRQRDMRITELSNDLAAAETALECRATLSAEAQPAGQAAESAAIELLIETADQFERLRHETPSPSALHARIVEARRASATAQDAYQRFQREIELCASDD